MPSNTDNQKTLSLTSECEFASVAHNAHLESVLTMASLKAPLHEPDAKRAGMDLVAVLDRSGSMAGGKMKMLHEVVKLMIENLSSKDRLALVAYDDNVETPLTLTRMDKDGKQAARTALASIQDRGCTNLSGGLMRGLDVIADRDSSGIMGMFKGSEQSKNEVASVMLMTDGLMNRGITNPQELVNLTEKRINQMKNPTSLYCFGFGQDHDSSLLTDLAKCGRGTYYFMDTVDTIPQAFADCLGGLMSVVAQNIEVNITAAPGVTINKVITSFTTTEKRKGQEYQLSIGDIFSEEERDILVDVHLPTTATATDHQPLVAFKVTALNVITAESESLQTVANIARSGKDEKNAEPSLKVDVQRNRIRTAQAMDEAKKHGDRGDLEKARDLLTRCEETVQGSASASMSAGLCADMASVKKNMASRSMYMAQASHKLGVKSRKHWAQRATECQMDEVDTAQDMYCNSSKQASRALWKSKFAS